MLAETLELIQTDKKSPKCPDFDADCEQVVDHWSCWTGFSTCGNVDIEPAKGYCPYCLGNV